MDGFISGIGEKLFSECGLISLLLMSAIVWLSLQLGKTNNKWETYREETTKLRDADRESVIRLLGNKNELENKLTDAVARIETLVVTIRAKRIGEDN